MREAGLEYVDLWRISLLVDSHQHTQAELDEVAEALEWAKKTGRARFIGVSSHDRPHLKTADRDLSRSDGSDPHALHGQDEGGHRRDGSVGVDQEARRRLVRHQAVCQQLDVQGRQFARQSHLPRKTTRSPGWPFAHILCNPAITAPMAGMITEQQVDNVCLAVAERRVLDVEEQAQLDRAMDRAWANLPPHYQWLKDWEYV